MLKISRSCPLKGDTELSWQSVESNLPVSVIFTLCAPNLIYRNIHKTAEIYH